MVKCMWSVPFSDIPSYGICLVSLGEMILSETKSSSRPSRRVSFFSKPVRASSRVR